MKDFEEAMLVDENDLLVSDCRYGRDVITELNLEATLVTRGRHLLYTGSRWRWGTKAR